MTSLDALPARPAPRAAATESARWSVTTSSDIEAMSRAWLSLEMSGLATPYQTLGWQRAAFAALHPAGRPCLVALRDRGGRIEALLPLVVERVRGVGIASFPGGKHANCNMGLFTEAAAAALSVEDIHAALHAAARQVGIDIFVLRNQPEAWRGVANPLLRLPHRPATSSAWRADLTADGDAFIASIMSSESRKKLRHKERRLGELGPIAYAEAMTPAEAEGVLQSFLRQKEQRFAQMGIRNPFAEEEARRFLDLACVQPLAEGPPAPVSLFAMTAGTRILAVFGGVIHAGRFSGMFTSFDPDPAVSKFSPGDLLLMNLVKTMCARGLSTFDLGAGDAAYKSDYCPIREPLFDSFLPMTLKGHAAALALAGKQRAKALAKGHAALLAPVRKLLGR
jgi:CelD/BcsL family acetyltransferase involved in cellulose biosynthesis